MGAGGRGGPAAGVGTRRQRHPATLQTLQVRAAGWGAPTTAVGAEEAPPGRRAEGREAGGGGAGRGGAVPLAPRAALGPCQNHFGSRGGGSAAPDGPSAGLPLSNPARQSPKGLVKGCSARLGGCRKCLIYFYFFNLFGRLSERGKRLRRLGLRRASRIAGRVNFSCPSNGERGKPAAAPRWR